MIEVRLHGRGGQGAVTAAELIAVSVTEDGRYAQAFPFFGVERTGAPIQAYCRIDDRPIRVHQNVYEPDIVIVLDASLLSAIDVCAGLKKNGIVIVNTRKPHGDLCLKHDPSVRLFTVDATGIALKHLGRPIVNTAMLGAFAKVTNLVHIDALKRAIRHRFSGAIADKNLAAIDECFASTG